MDVSLSSSVAVVVTSPVDRNTVNSSTFRVSSGGVKAPGEPTVSADGRTISLDPTGTLDPTAFYTVEVTTGIVALDGNIAVPFTSTFGTAASTASGTQSAGDIGETSGGATVSGEGLDDNSGFAVAVVGDVNNDGIGDLLLGAPNADTAGGADVDAGKATLIFGSAVLQSNETPPLARDYVGREPAANAGWSTSGAGDINNDGVEDMIVGEPNADPGGSGSGAAYVVFGNDQLDEMAATTLEFQNLASCASPSSCGIEFNGVAAGDEAGFAVSFAGDINDDGIDDLLIGAPGATVGGNVGAGKVYLVYGPVAAGLIDLSTVGSTTPGLVFHGENAGDRAGESISHWPDFSGDGIDDLLIGAPLAAPDDPFGDPIMEAGYVYAIHGGTTNLDDSMTPGIIALSRVANGLADEVQGTVFLGTEAFEHVGRHLTGAIDYNGDGEPDVLISGDNVVYGISGDGPKTKTGSTPTKKTDTAGGGGLFRSTAAPSAEELFDTVILTPGADGDVGELTVAGAGDINGDGIDDFIVGAPGGDPGGLTDAGTAYIVYGQPALNGEILLSDIGVTEPGLRIDGNEAGDMLGAAVGGGADLNGDGVDDAMTGAPLADGPGQLDNSGETYVISPISPDEVMQLTVNGPGNGTILEWSVGNLAFDYNVYRGDIGVLRAEAVVRTSSMAQFACGINTDADFDTLPDTIDADVPVPGVGYYYLVTGNNQAGEGTLGTLGAQPTRIHDGKCP